MRAFFSQRGVHLFCLLMVGFLAIAAKCSTDESVHVTATGDQSLKLTERMIGFGPRPPGSGAHESVRAFIHSEVVKRGLTYTEESFKAATPIGEIEMKNLSALIPGARSGFEVLLVAHYDSKRYVGFDFVGANDAASSVCLLLALSDQLAAKRYPFDVRFLFVDGEEALVNWTSADSLYGSRQYVSGLADSSRIRAVFVVDMIGDADLKFIDNEQSSPNLRSLQKAILKEEGLSSLMDSSPVAVEDDHVPFVRAGIPTLHIMDFSYPPWHTEKDTMDKLSARSLSITGELILKLLDRLPQR